MDTEEDTAMAVEATAIRDLHNANLILKARPYQITIMTCIPITQPSRALKLSTKDYSNDLMNEETAYVKLRNEFE